MIKAVCWFYGVHKAEAEKRCKKLSESQKEYIKHTFKNKNQTIHRK